MYSFKSRVRYSEITQNKYMDLSSIINYFQDCSTFQSEDIGLGVDVLKTQERVWMVSSWQIIVNRYPKLGENITIGTWAYDFTSMYGYRNFIIYDEKNEVVAVANSIWILVDTYTGKPTKVLEENASPYGKEEKYDMVYADRKIPIPRSLDSKDSFLVVKSNIDTNRHVNNCEYIKMAEEYLPDDFIIYQMRADYKKAAVLGDTIFPSVSYQDNLCTVVLADESKRPYVVIEFTRRKDT